MTWEQGRRLASYTKTGLAISYAYNENGIRTSKTVNGVNTSFRLSGNQVTYESNGTDSLYYTYDTQGQLVSVILNGTEYSYERNGQNDIIGLIDSQGNQVVSYTYGTWGQPLTITGSLASTLGVKNPYRYRGYRFDTETGLYYLQSRYYNPQWGRFLNADGIISTSINLLAQNMFAYCYNNPINTIDSNGNYPVNLDAIQKGIEDISQFIVSVVAEIKGGFASLGKAVTDSVTFAINTINRAGNIIHDKKVHSENVMEIGSGRSSTPLSFRNTKLGEDANYVQHCKDVYKEILYTQQMLMPEQDLNKVTWDQLTKLNQETIYKNMEAWDKEVFDKFFYTYGKDQVIEGIHIIIG